jgi:hypothetical protein
MYAPSYEDIYEDIFKVLKTVSLFLSYLGFPN